MKGVIQDVPECTGGSSTEVVLQNLELVECVWAQTGAVNRRVAYTEGWRVVRYNFFLFDFTIVEEDGCWFFGVYLDSLGLEPTRCLVDGLLETKSNLAKVTTAQAYYRRSGRIASVSRVFVAVAVPTFGYCIIVRMYASTKLSGQMLRSLSIKLSHNRRRARPAGALLSRGAPNAVVNLCPLLIRTLRRKVLEARGGCSRTGRVYPSSARSVSNADRFEYLLCSRLTDF
ncbi:hypothetical protein EVAR_16127_1 [Eumeta japonica]|uniref:Uncharacterized protein n=1 Tax=Eumeta variegata TaxID=151549 RepID=A0A4C1UIG7_EUMVA|nr:hypothetical protein EVAR_16127_1 [Eumeta japonica]